MRRNNPLFRRTIGAVAILAAVSAPEIAEPADAPANAPPHTSGELDFLRRECVAAAHDLLEREEAMLALQHAIDLLGRDADGRQRGLDESRGEQARLLATLAYLGRHPPDRPAMAPSGAIERIRGELLLQSTLPALREQARALSSEIERIKVLRRDTATRQAELGTAREALDKDRERLAGLTARRSELTGRLLPEESGGDARIAKLGREASDLGDLIKRAEAAAERRDKDVVARARAALPKPLKAMANAVTADTADPTRPRALRAFDPPQSSLQMPVAGTITQRFGATDPMISAGGSTSQGPTSQGPTSQGISLTALPGGEVVAPFDGRVIYAGPFRNLGLVLIIRHGGLYHSLLAGFGRLDIKADQWVLAGEPVGVMPNEVDKASGSTLYVELRRDGRPVDPQPWLAAQGQGDDQDRNNPDGNQKVRQ